MRRRPRRGPRPPRQAARASAADGGYGGAAPDRRTLCRARAGGIEAAVAVAGAAATAFAAHSGQRTGMRTEQAAAAGRTLDVQDASTPNARTPSEIAAWQGRQRVAQHLVPLASGASIVLNAHLVQVRAGATVRGLLRSVLRG